MYKRISSIWFLDIPYMYELNYGVSFVMRPCAGIHPAPRRRHDTITRSICYIAPQVACAFCSVALRSLRSYQSPAPFGGARNGLLIPAYRHRTDFPVRSPSKEQEVHAVPYFLSPVFVSCCPYVGNIARYAPLGFDGDHHPLRPGAIRLWRSQERRLLEEIEVTQKSKAPRRIPRGLLVRQKRDDLVVVVVATATGRCTLLLLGLLGDQALGRQDHGGDRRRVL